MIFNKDQVKGRVKEAEGNVKKVVGKIVGNRRLEIEGTVKAKLGEAQAKLGDIKQNIKDSTKLP
jgi:uncharacterized protein YjbJ (UPF0337 family)